jgi:type IX secretion system PorP/SprF family membrane protein
MGLGFEIGTFYEYADFRLGASLAQVPASRISGNDFAYKLASRINFFCQYNFRYSQNILFQPSMNLRYSGSVIQTDIGIISVINGKIFGGISLRGYSKPSLDAVCFILGHKLSKNWSLYYGYDFGISGLRKVHDGSHEIMIKMNLFEVLKPTNSVFVQYSPRFLL